MGKKNRSRKKKSPPKDGAAPGGGAAVAAAAAASAAGDASATAGACCAPPPKDVAAAASTPAALFAPTAQTPKLPNTHIYATEMPCPKPPMLPEYGRGSGTVLAASAGMRIEAAQMACCPEVTQVPPVSRASERAASADSALSPPPAAAASGGKKKKRGRKKPQSDTEGAPEPPNLQKTCPRTKSQGESHESQVCPIAKSVPKGLHEAGPKETDSTATCTCPHPAPMPPSGAKKRNKKKGKSPPKESAGVVPMQGIAEQPQPSPPPGLPEPKPAVIAGTPPTSVCTKPVVMPVVAGSSPDVKKPSPPPSSRKRPRVKVDEVAIEIVATDVCSSKTLGLSWDDVAFNDLQEMCSQSDEKMEEETVSQILKGVQLLESGNKEVKDSGSDGDASKAAVISPSGLPAESELTTVAGAGEVMAVPPPVPHCPGVVGQQTVAVVQAAEKKPVQVDSDDDDCCMDFGDAFLSDISCEHTSTPAVSELSGPQKSAQEPPKPVPAPAAELAEPPKPAAVPSVEVADSPKPTPASPAAVESAQAALAETPTITTEEPEPTTQPQGDETLSPKSDWVKFGSLSFADVVKRPRTVSEAEREKIAEEARAAEGQSLSTAHEEVDVYDAAVERAVWCYLREEGQRMQSYQQAELAESRYQEWLCSSTRQQPVEPWMQACPYMMSSQVTTTDSTVRTDADSTARCLREDANKMEIMVNASKAEASYFAKQSQMMQETPKTRRSPVKLVCESSESVTPGEQIASLCLRNEAEKMNDLTNATKAEARYFEQLSKQVSQPVAKESPTPITKPSKEIEKDALGRGDSGDAKPATNQKVDDESDDNFGGIDLGDAFLADIPCELTSTPLVADSKPVTTAKPAEDSDDDFGGIDLGDAFLADVPCEQTTTPVVADSKPANVPKPAEDSDDDFGGIDLGDAFLADVPCEQTSTPAVTDTKPANLPKPTEDSDDDDDFGGVDFGDAFLADIPCDQTSTPGVNDTKPKPVEDSDDDDDFGGIDLGDAFLADVPCEKTGLPEVKPTSSEIPSKPTTDARNVPCAKTTETSVTQKAHEVPSAPKSSAKRPIESDDDDDMAMDFGDAFLCDIPCENTSTPLVEKPAVKSEAKQSEVKASEPVVAQQAVPLHRAPAPIESDSDDEMELGDAFLVDVPCEKTTTPVSKKLTLKTDMEDSFDLEMEPFPVKDPTYYNDGKVGTPQSTPQSPGEYLLAKTIKEEDDEGIIAKELKERKHLAELSNYLTDSTLRMEQLKNAMNSECKYQEIMTSRSRASKAGKKRDRTSSDRSTPDSGHRMAIVEVEEVGIQTMPQKSPVILTPLRKSYKEALETPIIMHGTVECQTDINLTPVTEPEEDGLTKDELLSELAKEKASCDVIRESGVSLKSELAQIQREMSEIKLEKMTLEEEVIHLKEQRIEEDEEARLTRPAETAVLVQLRQEQERCAEIEHAAMVTKEELVHLRHHVLQMQRKNALLQRDFHKLQEQKIREEEEAKLTRPAEMAVLAQLRQEQERCARMERAAVATKEELMRLKKQVIELHRKNTLLQRECCELQEQKMKADEEMRLTRPAESAVLSQLREEQERCAEIEHAAIMIKQELMQLRKQMREMERKNMQLQRECSTLQSEVNLQSKFAEEYKQRNKVVESELTASRQKILKLEDDLQKAIAFQSGMDLMLDAKMASDRAKDAETRAYALQTELTSAHIQIKQLTEKLVELTRDRGDMVSASVHQEALSRSEARAQEAEYQVMRLQNELLQIRGLAEVCLTPDSPPPAHTVEGSGADWPTLGESASRVTWAGVASRGIPPETTIDIADLPSTEIRGFQQDTLNVSSFDQGKSPGVTPELSTGEESDWSSSVDSDPIVGPPSLLMRKHATEGSTSSDQAGAVGDPEPGELAAATRVRPAIPPKPPGLAKIASRSGASSKSEKSGKPKLPPKPTISRKPRPDNHESTTPTDVGGEVSSSFDEDLETPKLRLTRKPRGPTDRRKPSKFCKESKP